jgi:hypothetical protein
VNAANSTAPRITVIGNPIRSIILPHRWILSEIAIITNERLLQKSNTFLDVAADEATHSVSPFVVGRRQSQLPYSIADPFFSAECKCALNTTVTTKATTPPLEE